MNSQRTILVVEDDQKTVELVKLYLERDGFTVVSASDGRTALELIQQRPPELIVLDLMLPKLGGLQLCRLLRSEMAPGLNNQLEQTATQSAKNVPIIMLTAKSTEDDILRGLELGADDYITKPFSPRELVARIRTVLRRAGDNSATLRQVLRYGDLVIDPFRHEVTWRGAPLPLTPKEFKLLETMSREPGRAFSRMDLVQRVFGFDYEGMERTVDAHIMNLRKKIEPDSTSIRYIQTIYGVGYRFHWDPADA